MHAPKATDRRKHTGKVKFSSTILPPYLRRTKSIEELLPWLYLKGISTGEFGEALAALLGKNAAGLSASTISRLNVKAVKPTLPVLKPKFYFCRLALNSGVSNTCPLDL